MKVFFNNEYSEESQVNISINNRGFNYGDGVFETIMADKNSIRFLNNHVQRLNNALNTLKISIPELFTVSGLNEIINELRKQNKLNGLTRIKIQVWRKSGGLFSPITNEAEFLITATESSFNFNPRNAVAIYNEFRLSPSPISKFKKLSSLQYIMGGLFKNDKQVDDIIYLDQEGNVAESLASNIFWIKDNIVYTPSLETGCIDGIMRSQIRSYLEQKSILFKEGKFSLSELLKADMAFVSNVAGINAILKIENTIYTKEILWFKDLQKELMLQE